MDYDYWLRIGKKYKPYYLSEVISYFRIHNTSKGNTGFRKQFREELQISKIHNKNVILTFLHKIHIFLIIGIYSLLNKTDKL